MIIATDYYVYIMGSANGRAIYIGVTNDIVRRVNEHKNGLIEGSPENTDATIYYTLSAIATLGLPLIEKSNLKDGQGRKRRL